MDKIKLILVIISLILIGTVIYLINAKNDIKSQLAISDQNNKALTDTLRLSKNKNGDTEASKDVVIGSSKDLEKLNKELADELKKENGKVYELNQIIANIKQVPGDTIKIKDTEIKYSNGIYTLNWNYDTIYNDKNNHHIKGLNKLTFKDTCVEKLETFILSDNFNFNLVTGLRENKDGQLEIFVRSDYPNLNVSSLEGAIIDPDKNPIMKKYANTYKFHIGPYIGLGFDNKLSPGFQIGLGVQYNLIGFNF